MINLRSHPYSRVLSHEARELINRTCKDKNIMKIFEIPPLFLLIYTRKNNYLWNEFANYHG